MIVFVDVVDEGPEDMGKLLVVAPDAPGNDRCTTLRALLARPMQFLEARLAEFVQAALHGHRFFQNIEADTALKDVFEGLNRD